MKKHQVKALLDRRDKIKELDAKWTPHGKQKEVIDAIKSGKKKIFIRAGRRSGKTEIAKYLSVSVAGLNSNSTISIITPSLKQGKKIYWKKRGLQNFPPAGWVSKEQNDDATLYFHNGSYIEIDGSENIDAHRGDEKDLVILDEYKDIDERFFSEVIEPMFATTEGIVVIIGTPPETPESHYRDLERIAIEDDSWAVIHWTSYDSPYIKNSWLDEKSAELEKRGEIDVFKREYLAEYTRGGKNSVFPMFSRSLHTKPVGVIARYLETVKDKIEYYWVNDPATSSTFGALFIAYYREKGQIFILDEIYAQDKTQTHTEAIWELANKFTAPYRPINDWLTVYDDAAVWFQNELLHKYGHVAMPANKASVKQEEGVGLFKSLLLKKNTVVIADHLESLMFEIENYIMLNGKYPLTNDHLIDCIRYFLNFAQVVLSLAENEDLEDNIDDYFELFNQSNTGLPTWMH